MLVIVSAIPSHSFSKTRMYIARANTSTARVFCTTMNVHWTENEAHAKIVNNRELQILVKLLNEQQQIVPGSLQLS